MVCKEKPIRETMAISGHILDTSLTFWFLSVIVSFVGVPYFNLAGSQQGMRE